MSLARLAGRERGGVPAAARRLAACLHTSPESRVVPSRIVEPLIAASIVWVATMFEGCWTIVSVTLTCTSWLSPVFFTVIVKWTSLPSLND